VDKIVGILKRALYRGTFYPLFPHLPNIWKRQKVVNCGKPGIKMEKKAGASTF
jgi:hypothetical protein